MRKPPSPAAWSLLSSLAAACASGSADDVPPVDAASPQTDAAATDGTPAGADAAPAPDAPAADAGDATGIAAARAAADGPVDIAVDGVWVTYAKPAVGTDPAGFFVQRDARGPALFVAVDPASLSPAPSVGDEIAFRVTAMSTVAGQRRATSVADVAVASSGHDVAALAQDVSAAADLVSALDDYDSELVTARVTLAAAPSFAGGGHVAAPVDTAAIQGDADLRLRVPDEVADLLGLEAGCTLTVGPTPLWRFNAAAQLSAWSTADVTSATCPTPTAVVSAAATSETEVRIELSRGVDPASLTDAAAQFVFDGGLTATAASADGRAIAVQTTPQAPGQSYTVTVAASVLDVLGAGVAPAAASATFTGFTAPAAVRINEVAAAESGGCDLIELRVVSGGSLEGFRVTERKTTILTFGALSVATNDLIVVHLDRDDANCNPGGSGDETAAPDQYPAATYGANYDTAYDWYSTDTGLTATDNVIAVENPAGAIVDAVFVSDGPTGTAAADTETRAAQVAAAGQWQMVGGGVPAGGFVDDAFNAHAVQDLGASTKATSIQRIDDTDDNDRDDWSAPPNPAGTFGALNVGQSPL